MILVHKEEQGRKTVMLEKGDVLLSEVFNILLPAVLGSNPGTGVALSCSNVHNSIFKS